jgi:hypothetical protein
MTKFIEPYDAMIKRIGSDGHAWAEEFCAKSGFDDVSAMAAWFCNAIEYAAANHPDVFRLKQENRQLLEQRDKAQHELEDIWLTVKHLKETIGHLEKRITTTLAKCGKVGG